MSFENWMSLLTDSDNAKNYWLYLGSFKNALAKAITKFGKNKESKSDSWLTSEYGYLRAKLEKNYIEFKRFGLLDSLTDVINYAMIILEKKMIEERKLKANSEYGKLVQENKDLSSNKYGDK